VVWGWYAEGILGARVVRDAAPSSDARGQQTVPVFPVPVPVFNTVAGVVQSAKRRAAGPLERPTERQYAKSKGGAPPCKKVTTTEEKAWIEEHINSFVQVQSFHVAQPSLCYAHIRHAGG